MIDLTKISDDVLRLAIELGKKEESENEKGN